MRRGGWRKAGVRLHVFSQYLIRRRHLFHVCGAVCCAQQLCVFGVIIVAYLYSGSILEYGTRVQGLRSAGGDTAQVRAGRRAALRGDTSALAQIVTEIHAPDLAVESAGASVAAGGDGDHNDDVFWVCSSSRWWQ